MKVTSCIPEQRTDYESKLEWLDETMGDEDPDLFITPQEYFGGAYIMEDRKSFSEEELMPDIEKLCKEHNTALVLGVEEDFNNINKEAFWFITKEGELLGKVFKIALPGYDHVSTDGYGDITPELEFEERFKTFELAGIEVGAIFCWEAFSNILWTGLSMLNPDLIVNMIKFGPNAWPKLDKEGAETRIGGFGYAGWGKPRDKLWYQANWYGGRFQAKCPVICSTNSWNLKPKSMPFVGSISTIPDQLDHEQTFWTPQDGMELSEIPEKVITESLSKGRIKSTRKSIYQFRDWVGEWPSYELNKFTMLLKMGRIERRVIKGTERKNVIKALKSD